MTISPSYDLNPASSRAKGRLSRITSTELERMAAEHLGRSRMTTVPFLSLNDCMSGSQRGRCIRSDGDFGSSTE